MTHSNIKPITENQNRANFYRVCSLTWIAFSIFMFGVNEFFFSLTGILALIAAVTISIKRIYVDAGYVKIEKKRLLTFLNSTKAIPLKTISKVEFEEGSFDRNTVLVEIGRAINAVRTGLNYLIFYFDDKPTFKFKGIGTKNEMKDFAAEINQMKK